MIRLREERVLTNYEARQRYIQEKQELVRQVERAIVDLCGHHRKAFENHLFDRKQAHIQEYLDRRSVNETAKEFYLRTTPKRWREREWERERCAEQYQIWIGKYTTHPMRDDEEWWEWHEWSSNRRRNPFVVALKPDAEEIIKADVKAEVDEIIQIFTRKTADKVLDVIVSNGKYECKLEYGNFIAGMFEGDVTLAFLNGTSFRTHLIVKTNYSALGKPYTQYPLTFHDVVAKEGAKPVAMLSQDEVYRVLEVNPWQAPPRLSPSAPN